jgi:ADP-ribose pyrophosphatase YjhB (NUDIX family)
MKAMAGRKPSPRDYLFHLFFRLARPVTLGVKAVVLADGDSTVFLVRHTYVPGWHLPGGGVEPGESAHAALERELREEGNIALTGEPELFGLYHNTFATRRDHIALYVCRSFRQAAPKQPDREIAQSGFFAVDALPEGTTASTLARIGEVREGKRARAMWAVEDGE